MATLIENAKKGRIIQTVRNVAKQEGVDAVWLCGEIAAGRVVIPQNRNRRHITPCGIGNRLRTKVNANIGTSQDRHSTAVELKKLRKAIEAGTDTVMDLSTGGDIGQIRRRIISECPVPLGTVPVYEAFVRASMRKHGSPHIDVEELFDVIEEHAADGVDFMTLHAALTRTALDRLQRQKRTTGIVSRGGALLASWMRHTDSENPLYEQFDRLLRIAKNYDVTLSLGDGLRPGCLDDASDRPQVQEMIYLGELAQQSLDEGVQTIIEGPGHMPMDLIAGNVRLEKSMCHGAPYYVLGPLVADIAPGYDHITSAIGGAIAAEAGADFLCYVTPSEHLGLPTPDDVRLGVIATRIAAHAADVCKLNENAQDHLISKARKSLDWSAQQRLSIDPEKFKIYDRNKRLKKADDKTCTMCGEYCAYLVSPE
ncbi:MAG: phosphomethylpyrimidine synthase ThiC [bacterium]